MAALAAVIAGIVAFVLGEWRYGILAIALAIPLSVTKSATRDTWDQKWYWGGLSVLLTATTISVAAFRADQWVVAIPAALVALAALTNGPGSVESKIGAVIIATALTLLILAPAKVLIVVVAAVLVIALLVIQEAGGVGCLPILAAVGVVIGAVSLWYYVEGKEREANVNRYGAAVFDLCVDPANLPGAGSVVPDGRVLFVESGQLNRGKLRDNYLSKLPGTYRAHNQEEIAEVVCIDPGREVIGSGSYTNGATCTRYQLYVKAYLVNLATGRVIAAQSFYGSTPSGCPSSTSQMSVTRAGDGPSSQAVADWVLRHIRSGTSAAY
jgi:hypothetical protein